MSIFAIGDLHLALAVNKPMDIFGGWSDYHQKIKENWSAKICESDTVVIAGDISWAMSLEQSFADFRYIEDLPGTKLLIKGNHDYWWSTKSKMDKFFLENGLASIKIIHNNCVTVDDWAICGTRGWMLEASEPSDDKISLREAQRLETSLADAKKSYKKPIVFMHYPVIYGEHLAGDLIDIMRKYEVEQCFYGHLHGKACNYAFEGEYMGIDFRLISADYLKFDPKLVKII